MPNTEKYNDIITRASDKYGVPASLIRAVIKNESGYDPNATSGAGAQGLMQLMPGTAYSLGVTNSYDPEQNIMGGTKLLADNYKEFGSWELALAAYNAGGGSVKKYGGVPPYSETQNYVKKVMADFQSGGEVSTTNSGSDGGFIDSIMGGIVKFGFLLLLAILSVVFFMSAFDLKIPSPSKIVKKKAVKKTDAEG